ncbi:serine/threonine-protein kinase [Planctomycetaceae bacterium SH139]
MVRNLNACRPGLLGDLLDDSLTPRQAEELTDHLDGCDQCRARLERLAAAPHVWRETRLVLSDPALRKQQAPKQQTPSSQPGPSQPGVEHSSKQHLSSQHLFEQTSAADGADEPADVDDDRQRLRALLPLLDAPQQEGSLGRLDHYEVRSIVGWGGMGVVLQAFDTLLGRAVAIKVLHPHLAAHGAARRRFSREARAAAAVNHPSVVPIHSVHADSQPPYLVMAFVPGGSLQDRLDREGPLETADLLRIGIQIADALAAAHAQGLVHRDVKPGNILLDHGQNRVLLSDFGLAQALDDATLTASGAIAGTPQYMSPEQARGEAVDNRSDLFSLGGLLYAMVTGRPPFRAESTLAVLQKISHGAPRPLAEVAPESPFWLAAVVAKLQAKDPQQRPQTAGDVADLLRQCLAHLRHPQENALPKELAELPLWAPRKPTASDQRGLRLIPLVASWFAAALTVCLLTIAGLVLWQSGGSDAVEDVNDIDAVYQTGGDADAVDVSPAPPESPALPTWQSRLPQDKTAWRDGLDPPLEELDRWLQQSP